MFPPSGLIFTPISALIMEVMRTVSFKDYTFDVCLSRYEVRYRAIWDGHTVFRPCASASPAFPGFYISQALFLLRPCELTSTNDYDSESFGLAHCRKDETILQFVASELPSKLEI